MVNNFPIFLSLLIVSIEANELQSFTEIEQEIFRKCEEGQCSFNPDRDLTPPQIIRRHGYPAEAHTIETEDGYLLTIHRIPGSKGGQPGRQPIVVQHGMLSSSSDWIDEGNSSLGFMLADAGYDVWLPNARGNVFSKGHAFLPLDSPQYWNFSWHEMGVYDMPAVLHFIANKTSQPGEILYVGHSMGTTIFFVMASMKPEVAKLIKFAVALAPVAYMGHVTSPIRYLVPFVDNLEWLLKNLGVNEFLPSSKLLSMLSYDCFKVKLSRIICENLLFALLGFDKTELNEDILEVVLAHAPAGTSTKVILHYAYNIKDKGNFQMYDYGPEGNYIQYGTKEPPRYNLKNVGVPTYLMYGQNDLLATPLDVLQLSKKLPNNTGLYLVPNKHWNHIDFLFGKDAPTLIYKPLIEELQKYPINERKGNVNVMLV